MAGAVPLTPGRTISARSTNLGVVPGSERGLVRGHITEVDPDSWETATDDEAQTVVVRVR
jgi:hypothetical protein